MIKYNNVPMVFDKGSFSRDLREEYLTIKATGVIDNYDEFCELCLNMPATTVKHFFSDTWVDNGLYPLMGSFLGVCNALGLDPRKYFVLEAR